MMPKSTFIIILLCIFGQTIALFDDQPKFLTEDGNFIIESAVNRNISFRLHGNGCLRINDVNIMSLVSQRPNGGSSPRTLRRLNTLEQRVNAMNTPNNRNILSRLTRLERVVHASDNGTQPANVNVRLRRLEMRMNELQMRLMFDNCTSNPCKNGGTCLSSFHGFQCTCPSAWTGATCDDDVNECIIYDGTDLGCQNGATCRNTLGGYTCNCAPGWVGLNCNRRTNDCLSASRDLCGHGTCVHTNDDVGYKCICDQGWTTNKVTPACSVDVDECQSERALCSMDPPVRCINLPGTYACGECPAGYTGNGHYCRDINECEINNGGCSILPMAICINTPGSSRCGPCPRGYNGDGRYCTRIWNPQELCSAANCHPLARCIPAPYGAMCACPAMYAGNGIGSHGCVRINGSADPCVPSPCLSGGTCISTGVSSFVCNCPPGTRQPICISYLGNACASSPCQNGGTCTVTTRGNYQCSCPASHTGENCATAVRSCGGMLRAASGILKYPQDGTYPRNTKCAWVIYTAATKVLNVTFTKFNLEQARECRYDFLQIHDGRTTAAHMIGRFCGNQLPKGGNFVTTTNMVYLWFNADNSTEGEGFELHWDSTDPICGGNITATSHGTIASPGSPGRYPTNRDCIWRISAPPGKRIEFHFFTMQLEEHTTCQYDYLAIYNGPDTDSPLIDKFCNTSHPAPLTASSNEVTLHFHSDADQNDAGFQIHYKVIEGLPGCGGTYTSYQGTIQSPTENGKYQTNLLCHFLIQLPKFNHIHFTMNSFDLEDSSGCDFDAVEIYDGATESDPLIGRFCGTNKPDEIMSTANQLLLVFKTDNSIPGEGFRGSYEAICSYTFTEPNGVVTSAGYPNIELNRKCIYTIEAPPNNAIEFSFIDFKMILNNDYDYGSDDETDEDKKPDCDSLPRLTAYESAIDNRSRIADFCGNKTPPKFVTQTNVLKFKYETSSRSDGRGFKGNYSFISIPCGGVIKTPGMNITPPMGSDGYLHNSNCLWIIDAPKGKLVQLKFVAFSLESDDQCTFDSVTVYDGYVVSAGSNDTPMGKFCGRSTPPIITTASNALTLVFRTDDSISGIGFTATYEFINASSICGGNIFASSGTIKSPGYPSDYGYDLDCIWILNAPRGKQIELIPKDFQLEICSRCECDSLEIRNGGSERSPLIKRSCGYDSLPIMKSHSNKMYIRLRTDDSISRKGFAFDYNTMTEGCGGVFTGTTSGTIMSPNYPDPYHDNAQCDWHINVNEGSTIKINIVDIELEGDSDCSFDYVEVFDGFDISANLLSKFCANENKPDSIESTSNNIFIRLTSDYSVADRGFELRFETNCNRKIPSTQLSGAIESLNFPKTYPDQSCQWTIEPPKGNKISVEFVIVDIDEKSHNECRGNHLKIEEKDSEGVVTRTEKICENLPKPFVTSNTVVFSFNTSALRRSGHKGFRLDYEVQGCGGHFKRPDGVFSSPNYPQPYPHETKCVWKIEVDFHNLIEITFNDFDLEFSPNCTSDGLIVANEFNSTRPIHIFCGSIHKTNEVVTSRSNIAYVEFFSDQSYSGRGFSASYRTIPARCGGTFQMIEGLISSPNYPKNYDSGLHCEYLIRTEPSHTLRLEFTDFDIERTARCTDDYIMIYDGPEQLGHKILADRMCGNVVNGTYNSTNSEMLVVFHSDHGVEAKGFEAKFVTNCGQKINATRSGYIEVGHNIRWHTWMDQCIWTITSPNPEEHISLDILHLENESIFKKFQMGDLADDCFRNLTLYNGDSIHAPILKQLGLTSSHPPRVTSSGNSLTLELGPAPRMECGTSFDMKAYYTTIDNECGGEFESISGEIASPAYPNSYPNNAECEYTIRSSPGNKLSLTFQMIDIISENSNCNQDYLEIRENSSSGKLLGVFCDKLSRPTFEANAFWLKFHSDNDNVGNGFIFTYTHLYMLEHSGDSGVITSPMYPRFIYMADKSYAHRITVPTSDQVLLTIDDNMILKRDSAITIYDGYDSTAPVLKVIMNGDTEPVRSTTNILFIEFEIMVLSESKFKIDWSRVAAIEATTNATNFTNNLNCTANSVIEVGFNTMIPIKSPGYPYGYDTNLFCQWTLVPAAPGYHVTAFFLNVDLESQSECTADQVTLGSSSDLVHFRNLTTLCSGNGGRVKFHGEPNLRIVFKSDYYTNRTGFDARALLACGGRYDEPNGIITMENLTTPFSTFRTCNWTVNVQRGRTIRFTIEHIKLSAKPDGSCLSSVAIHNGPSEEYPFVEPGKICGEKRDEIINMTSSNKAYIQYISTADVNHGDVLRIKYEQVEHDCGGFIVLNSEENTTIIATPNYPNTPNPFIECTWRIIAPGGELIRIESVGRFDLKRTPTCQHEYLQIIDGNAMTTSASTMDKLCGDSLTTIVSSGNSIRLKYFNENIRPGNGFKLKLSLTQCDRSIFGRYGSIQSPGYPRQMYTASTTCEYHITGTEGRALNLTFFDLNLPRSRNCSETDHVIIYSIGRDQFGNQTLEELAVVCGMLNPGPIISDTSRVLVKFIANKGVKDLRGFQLKFNSTGRACGGELNAEAGIITSPGYPVSKDTTRSCEWRITTTKGKRITVVIEDFDVVIPRFSAIPMRPRMMGLNSGLNFYNSFDFLSRIAHIGIGNLTVRTFKSSDNRMLISSIVSGNTGHRGFKIRFSSDEPSPCVGNFDEDENQFETPSTNESYACEYIRTDNKPFGENGTGSLAIKMEVTPSDTRLLCIPDIAGGVEIIYKKHLRRIILSRCPPKYDVIITPYSSTRMIIRTTFRRTAVRVSYKIHKCGGSSDISDKETVIRRPELPDVHDELDCAWHLYTNVDQMLQVTINRTTSSTNCENEFINVYSGESPNSPRVYRSCEDDNLSRIIFTQAKNIFVEYHTNNYSSTASTAFTITVSPSDGICGGIIQEPNFSFSPPTSGNKYTNNMHCEWTIISNSGYHVSLSFVRRFMLETSPNCSKDYVEVFDVDTEDITKTTSLGRFCGREFPPTMNSTGLRMKIVFHTDADVVGDGFKVEWKQACGGTFMVSKKMRTLTSPNYPKKYPPDLFCNFTFLAPKNEYILLKFTDFDLEDTSRSCQFDNLTIFAQPYSFTDTMQEVGVYCAQNSPGLIRRENRIDLIFKTDNWLQKKGFSINYSIDECGFNITESTELKSPVDDKNNYFDNLDCTWRITAPSDKRVVIRFEEFDLEGSYECSLDSVEVYEGTELKNEARKAKLCGNLTLHAPTLNIQSNNAIVRFSTDSSVSGKGFRALILLLKNCDREYNFTESNRSIRVDQLFTEYEPNLKCVLTFHAPADHLIQVQFNQFHLSPCTMNTTSSNCSCDYLNVRDGSGPFSEPIGTFCGQTNPNDFISSGNTMWMLFATDADGASTGFSFTASIVPSPCGTRTRKLTKNSAIVLEWPINGRNYASNLNCVWEIVSEDDEVVHLSFEKFELQGNECKNEYLQIENEGTGHFIAEGLGENTIFSGSQSNRLFHHIAKSLPHATQVYCGAVLPPDYMSNGNKVNIQFKTDGNEQRTAFKLAIKELDACSRNYTSLQGRIADSRSNGCELFVSVPENNTLNLYFSRFDLTASESNAACTVENADLKVYDVKANRLIRQICGPSLPDPIFSTSNILKLSFRKSDITNPYLFLYDITYVASNKGRGCGGELFNYGGVFTSPGYPNVDRNITDCTWTVNVPQNLVVSLLFDVFDMGPTRLCDENFVELRDPLVNGTTRKYCGSDKPAHFKSTGNTAIVHFKSSTNIAGTGWVISFVSAHADQEIIT